MFCLNNNNDIKLDNVVWNESKNMCVRSLWFYRYMSLDKILLLGKTETILHLIKLKRYGLGRQQFQNKTENKIYAPGKDFSLNIQRLLFISRLRVGWDYLSKTFHGSSRWSREKQRSSTDFEDFRKLDGFTSLQKTRKDLKTEASPLGMVQPWNNFSTYGIG